MTAYSPLGTPDSQEPGAPVLLEEPVLARVAERHETTPATVCLRYALERDLSVIPKSVTPSRIVSNLSSTMAISLSDADLKDLASIEFQHVRLRSYMISLSPDLLIFFLSLWSVSISNELFFPFFFPTRMLLFGSIFLSVWIFEDIFSCSFFLASSRISLLQRFNDPSKWWKFQVFDDSPSQNL